MRWPAVTENEFVPFELKRGHIGCASEHDPRDVPLLHQSADTAFTSR